MSAPRQLLERLVIGLALMIALIYAGDYIYLRIRMIHPKPTDPFESITAPRILAIEEKNNRVSYQTDEQNPTQTFVCAHSLFPHYGNQPCWYLKKKIDKPIPMTILVTKVF
jgi:hypothetical protein